MFAVPGWEMEWVSLRLSGSFWVLGLWLDFAGWS